MNKKAAGQVPAARVELLSSPTPNTPTDAVKAIAESSLPTAGPITSVMSGEILTYRQRMRLAPNPVAQAFGMTADELLKLEVENQPLSPDQVQKWQIFTSVTRKSRGHIRRAAPRKDLPFERPKCEECGLPLWRPKLRYSKRASQWLWQLFCGTEGCSRRNRIISFEDNTTGERVEVPSFFKLPHERGKCAECSRHFVLHSSEKHPELGLIRRMYCDNSGCKMQYAVHWFNDKGVEVRRPLSRENKLLTFPEPPCLYCGGPTVSRGRHQSKSRGHYFYFGCKKCLKTCWSSDGVVAHKCESRSPAKQVRHQARTGKRRGPAPMPEEQRSEYKIGKRVDDALPTFEKLCSTMSKLPRRARTNRDKAIALLKGSQYSPKQIEAATHAPSQPLISARWFIALETHLGYNVVAEYSRRFKRAVANPQHN